MGNFMVLNLFLALLLNSFNSEELKSKKEVISFALQVNAPATPTFDLIYNRCDRVGEPVRLVRFLIGVVWRFVIGFNFINIYIYLEALLKTASVCSFVYFYVPLCALIFILSRFLNPFYLIYLIFNSFIYVIIINVYKHFLIIIFMYTYLRLQLF